MDFELTRLNFEESQIMSGLTESKVIGRGGSGKVYRVSVNNGSHGDDVFAVKQIRNDWSSEKNFEKQFNAEVKVLRSIRHPNVVQLIDSFSSDNFKFLVYEYLPHMSLDRWLHYENEASSSTAPHEWAWRHLEQGKAIVDALDEKIKQPCYIDEIRCVFNLGLNCTQRKPSARPSMKKVIHLLLKCGQ
ncbi:hypothetical protein FEM48_Zijuj12G0142500 [Ziziphus jujuba var. spinosa]|uniref:Protein kinase domain-containing protein n=1 Tax=Ziziphus jujuba var. spinosa TaxID=714518 RepID=A0A978UDT6_ZIZJJ|nr:hypothetical protein FEM48_Zijuj12G0142500 [Ziziphus jujuba var. spinosa]